MASGSENTRPESEVFRDIEALASTPGYAHAIAAICFRDNTVSIRDEIEAEDIARMFSDERLIRTEISTLIGLMVKSPLILKLPEPAELQSMIDKTDALLRELHDSMKAPMVEFFRNLQGGEISSNPFTQGSFLREAIFYGEESAYRFQYRDLSVPKYSADNRWIETHKGFSIEDGRAVITSIVNLQNEHLASTLRDMRTRPIEQWTMLPAYTFSVEEVVAKSGLASEKAANVLGAFALPANESNSKFRSVGGFNVTNAFPLISLTPSTYLCFQSYSIAEALYESPFYWMLEDEDYTASATDNRGKFNEDYCAKRLIDVFGADRVFKNVTIRRGRKIVGEIDVLVIFANRIIIVQAKSKRLTIESRKGNDNQLKDDFKRGILSAYNQGFSCARLLSDDSVHLVDGDNALVKLRIKPKEIYIFCVLSEHYPALAFQARQFLTATSDNVIMPPFVMDIFTLDVIAEMLSSPLYFLSYLNRRVGCTGRIIASHELTILSYHLKMNLWIGKEYDLVQLDNEITSDLDIAMLARREGLPGKCALDGILTRFKASSVGKLINQIEHREDPASIDLGFMLLTLNENTINQLSDGIDYITKQSSIDRTHHDITIGTGTGDTGITVHSNFDSDNQALLRLLWHCKRRKYSQRAGSWFGLCLTPGNGNVRFGIDLEYPWEQSDELDQDVADLSKLNPTFDFQTDAPLRKSKVGRNDPCPCGSGRKYKKCCLNRAP